MCSAKCREGGCRHKVKQLTTQFISLITHTDTVLSLCHCGVRVLVGVLVTELGQKQDSEADK